MIHEAIARVQRGEDLTMDQLAGVLDGVMDGNCDPAHTAQLLTALHEKGETVAEIAGAALALRRHMTPLRSRHGDLLDTCGTGGDRSGTFNISTAAALVAAAAGVPVAKHGNRGITSRSGSADVLAVLGVNIDADVATVERCLDQVGIGFCFAPLMHPSMRHVAAVRRQLTFPTIFNLIGPLCNPALAPFQLLGVGRAGLRCQLAEALVLLGIRRAAVVRSDDGLDEVSISGPTRVTLVEPGPDLGNPLTETTWTPESFGIPNGPLDALRADGPAASAAMIRDVLRGHPGPARHIVVINAAAALWVAGRANSLTAAATAAAQAIDDGSARRTLQQLGEVSHGG